jgi:starch synthase (maltosyl-transferring)
MRKREGAAEEMPKARIVIENVLPCVDGGAFPIKRVPGEEVVVTADVFADGHDEVAAFLLYRASGDKEWREVPMKGLGNDAWTGSFRIEKMKDYAYTVRGYIDEFSSWRHDLKKKIGASRDVRADLEIGGAIVKEASGRRGGKESDKLNRWAKALSAPKDIKAAIELALGEELASAMSSLLDPAKSAAYAPELRVMVERSRALFSSWYEIFPRSWADKALRHGTFGECARMIPYIARLGFDVLYLAPIHPIGKRFRKGRNNSVNCSSEDPGSPWAVGSAEGGHKSVHPQLGTLEDFRAFAKKAKEHGLEIALDIALQCSPDHPYLKSHPGWFKWRPDGTVQYAENPPKKYEDIVPFNFDTKDREGLWMELKSIFTFWIEHGVRIFRVDNPHTKPFAFWDWLIADIRKDHPDVILLSEAFTRPKIMYRLAKAGFSQSYTYFTWRSAKQEFMDYLTELAHTEVAEYFRPNFWPNTPDILAFHLQQGGRGAFKARAVMASTMSSNYGVYAPAFELCVDAPLPGREEYMDSEKYEIKRWDLNDKGSMKDLLKRLNKIRRENPALQATRNIRFCGIDNDQLIAYWKATDDLSNIILVIVNLDPRNKQSGWLELPLADFGMENGGDYTAHDLLRDEKYAWKGARNYVELDPASMPAHVIRIGRRQ